MLETDPVCLATDDDGNLLVPLQFARGSAAVRQVIQASLRLIKGELFFDVDAGVAWIENDVVSADQAILGGVFDENKVRAHVRRAILRAPNVDPDTLVIAVSFDGATRELSIDWEIDTVFGETINGTITQEA